MAEPIIGDDTYQDPSWYDGTFGKGLVPRDMAAFPVGSFAPPATIKPYPRKEWPERIRQQKADKSRLSDIWRTGNNGARIPALNQNDPKYQTARKPRWGYCWCYATVGGLIVLRAVMNQPYVRLSAFGAAYTMKNGVDEGSWGAMSLDFAINRGIPSEDVWPNFQQRQIPPANDPIWQDAAKYKATHGFMELEPAAWDRDLSFDQEATQLLNRAPVIKDQMYWGHCVVGFDLEDAKPNLDAEDLNRYGVRILNSWGDEWGEDGFALQTGSKKFSDNAVSPSVVLAT